MCAIIWHEAIAGRLAAEVTSAFLRYPSDIDKDAEHVTIWCENCSAKNKNCVLYTLLARVMNSTLVSGLKSITLKYLETGHTIMSCDSFHGLVEKQIRKNILTFKDF